MKIYFVDFWRKICRKLLLNSFKMAQSYFYLIILAKSEQNYRIFLSFDRFLYLTKLGFIL